MKATSHSSTSRKNGSNVRWKPLESKFFLEFMATQVENGLKCDKTFKPQAIQAVKNALREIFGKYCTEANIHNHLRTLKRKWVMITKLLEMSGVGWDEDTKKIIIGEEECKTYLMSHPAAEPYINKTIEEYALLEVVCDTDHATGRYARDTIETTPATDGTPSLLQDDFNIGSMQDDIGIDSFDTPHVFDTSSPTTNNSHRRAQQDAPAWKKGKRRDQEAEFSQTMAAKMDRLALAIEEHNPVSLTTKLSEACMKLVDAGYSTRDVTNVYVYYAANESLTVSFLGAKKIMRQYMADEALGDASRSS